MSRVYAQSFSRLKVFYYKLSGKLEPGCALSADVLQAKPITAENACAQGLLESHADLNLRRGAEKTMTVNHVLAPGADLDGHDVAWKLGRESQLPARSRGSVFRHEKSSTSSHAANCAKNSSASAQLRVGGHLDRARHPRKFSSFGDHRLVRFKNKFEDGHGCAQNTVLHDVS